MPIRLGGYELERQLGVGGMGAVWLGHHGVLGRRAAVKVIAPRLAHRQETRAAFFFEVEAMASLVHPGILEIYDLGVVPEEVSIATAGEIGAETPWFAMTYAEAGSLAERRIASWVELRGVLLELLDALAHAHARGIVHRDLKPQNVLLVHTAGGLRCQLTDFGIAHALDPLRRTENPKTSPAAPVAGTPAYMAPEQFLGEWRDYGPWTDLYSLGCLAYELCCGTAPFTADSLVRMAWRHANAARPALQPRFAVPAGLEGWIHHLLAPSPGRRPTRAAEAARALEDLGDELIAPPERPVPARPIPAPDGGRAAQSTPTRSTPPPDNVLGQVQLTTINLGTTEREADLATVKGRAGGAPGRGSWPAWSDLKDTHTVGLGLFGLREIPFVGRRAERATIWSALNRVRVNRRSEVVVIRGSAGVGKSRLAQWIMRRAHEVGGVAVMRATHSPRSGPADGVSGMLLRAFNCFRLDAEACLARLQHLRQTFAPDVTVHETDLTALCELLVPSLASDAGASPPALRMYSSKSRYGIYVWAMSMYARQQPLVVWLDDVQWGAETLRVVDFLISKRADVVPTLILMTVREESLEEAPTERQLVERLEARQGVDVCFLEALPSEERSALVERILPLEPDLARRVAEFTLGLPLLAVQLIAGWVQRGDLALHTSGYQLAGPLRAHLPSDIDELWAQRIDDVLAGLDDAEASRTVLYLAAALGQQVVEAELEAASACLGVAYDRRLVDALVGSGLARRFPDHWAFVHGTLREHLEARARQDGRHAAVHRAVVEMLAPSVEAAVIDLAPLDRTITHLLAAGMREAALEAMLDAAGRYVRAGNHGAADALLSDVAAVIETLAVPADDERRGQLLAMMALAAYFKGELEYARSLAQGLIELSRRHGWAACEAEGLTTLAHTQRLMGEYASAHAAAREALAQFKALDLREGRARALHVIGNIAIETGQLEDSEAALLRCAEIYHELGQPVLATLSCYRLIDIYLARDDFDRAHALSQHHLETLERFGSTTDLGIAYNSRAEIARNEGDYDLAEGLYQRAGEILERSGSWEYYTVRSNQVMLGLLKGDFERALADIAELRPTYEAERWLADLFYLDLYALPGLVERGDDDAVEATLARIRTNLPDAPRDADLARAATIAADRFGVHKRHEQADELLRVALLQWTALGRRDKVREVESMLGDIED